MITVPHDFYATRIAAVAGARELAMSPSGDLYVGTRGGDVYVIRRAENTAPGPPAVYVHFDDAPAAGVAFGNGTLYVGTQHAVWAVRNGRAQKLAAVRTGNPPPGSDGDVHATTSIALDGNTIYASVGSSCNACVETDPTRATVGRIDAGRYVPIARRIRNAIALAVDPLTHALWASDAGQDELPAGHPYEFLDDVAAHRLPVDYGWPFCYENRRHKPGTNDSCSHVVVPQAIFPAYETPIGAAFYPSNMRARYAFPQAYAGGAFVTLHGSWHGPAQGLPGYEPPRVVFMPMRDGRPLHAANWNDPTAQWSEFAGGYQQGGTIVRSGRPTGIAVGPLGDLFIADDFSGALYRIRPKASPASR